MSNATKARYLEHLEAVSRDFADICDTPVRHEVLRNATFQQETVFLPGERILYAAYRKISLIVARNLLLFGTILTLIFIAISSTFLPLVDPFDLLFPGPYNSLSTLWSILGIVTCIVIVIAMAAVGLQVAAAKATRYVITDRRIIVGYTFFWRMYRSFYLDMILDLIVKQGPLGRLLDAGSVILVTASDEGTGGLANAGSGGTTGQRRYAIPNGLIGIHRPIRMRQLLRVLMRWAEERETFIPPLALPPLDVSAMPHGTDVDLLPGEQAFKAYHRTGTSSFCFLCGLLVPIALILVESLDLILENLAFILSILPWIILAFVACVVLLIVISRFHARGHLYLVTSHRVIAYKKFLSIRCRDAIIGMITEISLQQVATGRVANFGRIKVMTKGFENKSAFADLLSIDGVPDAPVEKDAVFYLILHFQEGRMFDPLRHEEDLAMLGI